MALLRLGSGMAPANSEMGTNVTNQKSFLALKSRTLAISVPLRDVLDCLRWMAAFTEDRSPITAFDESKNAMPLATCGLPSGLDSGVYLRILTPWKRTITPPFAVAAEGLE